MTKLLFALAVLLLAIYSNRVDASLRGRPINAPDIDEEAVGTRTYSYPNGNGYDGMGAGGRIVGMMGYNGMGKSGKKGGGSYGKSGGKGGKKGSGSYGKGSGNSGKGGGGDYYGKGTSGGGTSGGG
eukprot:CAMPEP_0119019948 /NCGR_PEP_ID=MMETSP1176-20130426/23027_1 /TAXON_ID=265551 /ORGANISM="Synedropsis recta cf, Strain CCMP1620" /LENGTH=125 /DNA_ID=CAMNT_0006974283 /DNA_START=28 /DNA_END=402 /DNA_ORIENTATION=+